MLLLYTIWSNVYLHALEIINMSKIAYNNFGDLNKVNVVLFTIIKLIGLCGLL